MWKYTDVCRYTYICIWVHMCVGGRVGIQVHEHMFVCVCVKASLTKGAHGLFFILYIEAGFPAEPRVHGFS